MTIVDGFWFQIGRGMAELLMGLGALAFVLIIFLAVLTWADWQDDKRNGRRK